MFGSKTISLVLAAGVATAAFGLLALAGWIMGRPELAGFGANRIPMAPSTAVLFLLYGLAVCWRARTPLSCRGFWAGVTAGGLGALVALLLFVLGGLNIHWAAEHLGFDITRTVDGAPIGHMSPVTAGCFLLVSVSFLASLARAAVAPWRAMVALVTAGMLLGTCFVFLLAYFFGTPLLYGGAIIPPALSTILAFMVLGLALLRLAGRPRFLATAPGADVKSALPYLVNFVLLAVVIVAASYFYYRSEEKSLRIEVERELATIADLKRDDLVQWRQERLADGALFSGNAAFSASVRRYFERPDLAEAPRQLRTWLSELQTRAGYDRVSLLDDRGIERFSSGGVSASVEAHLAHAGAENLRSGRVTLLDFHRDAPGRPVHLAVLAPLFEPDGPRPLGVLVLLIDPAAYLYPFIQRWPTPSRSAETLLVRREGPNVVYLNPLRFRENTALALRVPLTNKEVPAVKAALGKEGIVDGLDYRGVPVIAAVRAVPDSPWFLVAKGDASEMYGPMRERLGQVAVLVGALLLGAGAGMGALWSRQQSRHHHEKYLAAQALRGSDARFRAVVDSANDAIVTIGAAGEIAGWNGAAEKIFGYTAAEMSGQPLVRLLPPAGHGDFLADLQRMQAGGAPDALGKVVELTGRRKDGTLFPMELSVAAWHVSGERFLTGTLRDITGRRQAEDSMRLQSAALNSAANAIVITDRDGTVVWANPAFTSLTGYPLAEAAGKNLRDLIKSDQVARAVYQDLWATILAGRVWRGELVNRRKDGSLYPEDQTITPVRDAAGGITHFIAIKQDRTEARRAEAARRESEERFRAIFEQAAVGVVIAEGRDGRYVKVNRRFCEIVGYSADELLQLTSRDITHPDDIATDFEHAEQIGGGIIREFSREKRYRKKDGSFVWTKVFVAPLDPTEARPTLRIGVVTDITERKLAERQLREQHEILSNAHEGVMIVNLANKVSLWNRGAERIFGWTAAEALGQPPEKVLGIEELGAVATLRAAVEREGFWTGELRAQSRDGRALIVEARITLVRDEAGRPRARLSYLVDVTEKKQLEERFLHAQRLESIGMLAAGIAHDLNNVLAPIVFAAPMLRESLTAPRDVKILDTLERSAARGTGLVKQILGFAHTTTGGRRPTQVKHLARDIIDVVEATFPKSIRLEHHIPSDLWPVEGDATQIHQVLLNLCVNARDAMPHGGTLRIAVANRRLDAAQARAWPDARPGAWLVLEVADTGTGIPPDVLERIWDPFFTTKGVGQGTGLGLSTVRGIVVSHHGFITLDTQPGQGTTFRVFLPAIDSQPSRPGSASPFAVPDGHGELVLVVDDDAAIRDTIAAILGKHGYRVESCADGVDAIGWANDHLEEISLLVTDVDMPHLDGVALTQALRRLCPGIKVLAISGLSDQEAGGPESPRIQELAHAFLPKPFAHETLLKTVHGLLHPDTNS